MNSMRKSKNNIIADWLDKHGDLEIQKQVEEELINLDKLREVLILQEPIKNWKLVRERDQLTNYSQDIRWIEWNNNGIFKEKHNEPLEGRSLLMSPFNLFFTWQTTEITEVIVNDPDYIKFRTKNSNYELFKIN